MLIPAFRHVTPHFMSPYSCNFHNKTRWQVGGASKWSWELDGRVVLHVDLMPWMMVDTWCYGYAHGVFWCLVYLLIMDGYIAPMVLLMHGLVIWWWRDSLMWEHPSTSGLGLRHFGNHFCLSFNMMWNTQHVHSSPLSFTLSLSWVMWHGLEVVIG